MADRYASIDELLKMEVEGKDFQFRLRSKAGRPAIIAPHGGAIEPGTSEIAEAIAGEDMSFYAFEGLRLKANRTLHITSTRFDEPRCLAMVQGAPIVVAIHGEESLNAIAYIGGRRKDLIQSLTAAMTKRDFRVERHANPLLQGTDEGNICNRSQSRQGVQLELSRGLRASFFHSLSRSGRRTNANRLDEFVAAVREVILQEFVVAGKD